MRGMKIKKALRRALTAYKNGDLGECLSEILAAKAALGIGEREYRDAQFEIAEGKNPRKYNRPFAYSWIRLAEDRIRQEMGEDIIAVCPVETALKTAINIIGD